MNIIKKKIISDFIKIGNIFKTSLKTYKSKRNKKN